MRINNGVIYLSFVIVLNICGIQALSQHNYYLGISLKEEKSSSTMVRNLVGLSLERNLNVHNSLCMQINYRTIIDKDLTLEIPDGVSSSYARFFIKQKFLSTAALYTYKTRLVNFTIGPSVDFYLDWKEEGHTPHLSSASTNLQTYQFDNKVLWGMLMQVSKSFKVNSKIIMEPGIFYNPVYTPYSIFSNYTSSKHQFYGVLLQVKYNL